MTAFFNHIKILFMYQKIENRCMFLMPFSHKKSAIPFKSCGEKGMKTGRLNSDLRPDIAVRKVKKVMASLVYMRNSYVIVLPKSRLKCSL